MRQRNWPGSASTNPIPETSCGRLGQTGVGRIGTTAKVASSTDPGRRVTHVAVYRADEPDAWRLHQLLTSQGMPAEIERFGPKAVYVVVNSTSPDVPELAKSAGRSVRLVLDLDLLA